MTLPSRPLFLALNQYHSLVPLDDHLVRKEPDAAGFRFRVIKGISNVDGKAYALRRFNHRHCMPTPELTLSAREAVDRWSIFGRHPHVSALRGTFVSADMGEAPALFYAYDYHAGSLSLREYHCDNGEKKRYASEADLWSYASQLCCVIRSIHGAGLAVGGAAALNPGRLIISPGVSSPGSVTSHMNRLRLAALGTLDLLHPDAIGLMGPRSLASAQRDDLRAVGHLLATLACGSSQTFADPVTLAQKKCSAPLGRLIVGLVTDRMPDCTIFSQLLAPVMSDALESERMLSDYLKAELSRELENGRLLRLLVKLAFVNDRPDRDMHKEWAETGDRYIIKLFRDFIFHQHNNEGAPVLDWGHVFECLNKLEVGVAERILLLSRDEMSMLVASYGDIKHCVQTAYSDLIKESSCLNSKARWQRGR